SSRTASRVASPLDTRQEKHDRSVDCKGLADPEPSPGWMVARQGRGVPPRGSGVVPQKGGGSSSRSREVGCDSSLLSAWSQASPTGGFPSRPAPPGELLPH